MPCHYRPVLAILLMADLILAGCANKPQATHPTHHTATAAQAGGSAPASKTAGLPQNTGIAACDDYLASYIACHQAAGIYRPDQIEPRYQAMRDSLLRDSQDPNVRPQMSTRCTALATQLREALHGKSCAPVPTAPSGGASR
ncbi:hypothetical protein [Dyella sedimenti]|uniref:hypothetical protein n=1 Tax=Dyella sedimenti TaxID=2919947 RepID=UPI001FAA5A41|nr:hypothetical protein [Dyella sedimenti]